MNATSGPSVAIVTGAGSGIGRAVSESLLRRGWCVLLADVSEDVHRTAEDLDTDTTHTLGVVGDVADPDVQERIVATALERFGGVDALVNNAAVGGPFKDVLSLGVDEFRAVLEVNLVATFALARHVAPVMIAAGRGGRIVNMGSAFGQQAVPNGAAYCASKGAITLLSQALALELARYGVTVNTVAPGYILTDMHRAEMAERARHARRSVEEERAELAGSVPLGRHGTPDDVAETVAWLLSDAASYVTGQTIPVNGGILLS